MKRAFVAFILSLASFAPRVGLAQPVVPVRVLDAGSEASGLYAYPTEVDTNSARIRMTGPAVDAVSSVTLFRGTEDGGVIERTSVRPKAVSPLSGVLDVYLGPADPHEAWALAEPLKAGTRYRYSVASSGGKTAGEFVTAPSPESDVQFLVVGDNRSDPVSHRRVVDAMMKYPRDLLVHTGDYVEVGSRDADWAAFFSIEKRQLASRYLVGAVGNHELIETTGASYLKYFAPHGSDPTSLHLERRGFSRAVRWGRAHFFLLNGMDEGGTESEKAWLEKELTRSLSDAPLAWRIVVLHHSPWSSGPHGPNRRLSSAGVVQVLVDKKVDLVLAGHDHIFERGASKGLAWVVSGGGGAPLYPIKTRVAGSERAESVHHFVDVALSEKQLRMDVVRVDESILESCTLAKGSAHWECTHGSDVIDSSDGGAKGETPPTKGTPPAPGSIDPAVWVFGGLFALGVGLALFSRRKKALPVSDKSDKNRSS